MLIVFVGVVATSAEAHLCSLYSQIKLTNYNKCSNREKREGRNVSSSAQAIIAFIMYNEQGQIHHIIAKCPFKETLKYFFQIHF